jgi:DNA-binding CsgD family transcriptional regulator/tetratricopeptide (TPR) repeat protein
MTSLLAVSVPGVASIVLVALDAPADDLGGEGRPLAAAPGQVARAYTSVGTALGAAARAARGGAAVGLAVGELAPVDDGTDGARGEDQRGAVQVGPGDVWTGAVCDVAVALADRARLGRRNGDGHIVATATVAGLAALSPLDGRAGLTWVPVGPLHTGRAGVVDCVELARPADRPAAPSLPLPAVLGLEPEFPFVGRAAAWESLVEAWDRAAGGGRRVVLVGGDAGTGKSRLVTELSRWVHQRGAAVLYGQCSEQSPVPYEPFAVALDLLMAGLDADGRQWLVGDRGQELARLVPRLAAAAAVASDPARDGSDDPGTERYRLFSAVVDTLGALAAERPVLLVLDDVHWARRPTLELLDHLVRSPGLERLCVVATFRSTPSEVGDDLKAALPDLRRQPGVARLVIGGLDRDEVRRFAELAGGRERLDDPAGAVDLLVSETGGNAFLLGELWRQLVEAGTAPARRVRGRPAAPAALVSPEGVREVVAARLGRLPDTTRDLVRLAAVVGTTFRTDVLATARGATTGDTVAALEPAVRARIVQESAPGEHRFLHALVRRAVVDDLPAPERRALARDVAHTLVRLDGDRSVAEVAFHLLAAVPLVAPDEAVDVARRAAAAARRAVAYDDAARLLEAVLPLVPAGRRRGVLLLEVADARMRAGDVSSAQARCLQATELGRSIEDGLLVVDAALAFEDANWRAALHGGVAEELLRAALPLADDPVAGVRVRAALSRALALSGKGDEAEALVAETVPEARALDVYQAVRVAYAAALFVSWTPDNLDRQRRTARELIDLARAEGDLEWELGAIDKLLFGTITAGDLDEARRLAAHHSALSARIGQPLFRVLDLQAQALMAMGEGRFVEAEARAEEADALAGFLSGNDAAGGYGVQLFSIRRDQGRLDEARPLVEAVARLDRVGATWRPALTVLQAELGLHDEARAGLGVLVAGGLAAVPRDSLWWASLSYLADAAVVLGDRDAALAVYRELLPARGLVIQAAYMLAAYGAADRTLGELCVLLDRHRDAETHFEAALRLERRARMPVWLARTQLAYGRFLGDRAGPGDRERAVAMLRAAREVAVASGMARLNAEATALVDRFSAARAAPASGAGDRPAGARAVAALTARELALLPLLAEGRTNREIGERLHISQHTAANHVRSILLKTGCANRTEAASWALRQGLAGH